MAGAESQTLVEIELKFQVPHAARTGVRKALATARARTTRLSAVYADSADGRLAAAGLALRLRREGSVWVQTLKGIGDGIWQRLEHEVQVQRPGRTPCPDPARQDGTPAGAALRAALGGAPLQVGYRTEVLRTAREVRHAGARIEVAFDEGWIVAGRRRVPVCELEFELKSGSPQALIVLAERWAMRHALWWDVRTKSERGQLLRGAQPAAPVTSRPVSGHAEDAPAIYFAHALQAALGQMLGNAAPLCEGAGTAEHLHQWRVAVRRLRTVLRCLGPWSADPDAATALEAAWREPFIALGGARDDDVLAALIAAPLARAGLPPWRPAPSRPVDTGGALREPAVSALALRTLALATATATAMATANAMVTATAAGRTAYARSAATKGRSGTGRRGRALLRRAWREAMKDAVRFADLPLERQHRLRKRLKRLRYAAEALKPALAHRRTERTLARLRDAVEALGQWNDACVAQGRLDAHEEDHPSLSYASTWLAGRRRALQRSVEHALRRLPRDGFQ